MDEVLILGNGISRLGKDDMVRAWPGEVWGCNRAYEEFPDKLSRLTGHTEILCDAAIFQDQHQSAAFEIWSGHVGHPVEGGKVFTCPPEFLCDSGTTLVAQALEEGRDVALLGFDLGGWDIHSPRLEKQDKSGWVRRWRRIAEHYGLNHVRFIGHDHKPFILSNASANTYAKDYRANAPHIDDPEYLEAWEKWTGRKAKNTPKGSVMVKVQFPNTYICEMTEVMAAIHEKKGEVVILGKVKEEKPVKPAKGTKKK